MNISYVLHWITKGDYGKERIRRADVRKHQRKKKNLCKCGVNNRTRHYHACPYAQDMHNDNSEHCRCCSDCSHECAMDI